jgi:hypothetical protein
MAITDKELEMREKNKVRTKRCAIESLALLKSLGSAYLARETFKPGDLVTWKDGLKDCRLPKYGQPGIIIEIREGQRDTREETGSCYYQTPNEARVAILDSDGDFVSWWLDLNRLQLFVE